MAAQKNISFVITTAYFVILLCGTLFFIPDIFVSRYITPPQLWLQAWLGAGLLLYAFLKRVSIHLPPAGYIVVILAWFFYHMVWSNWNFESFVNFLTVITAFLVFYWYWKEISGTYILFGLFACLGLALSVWGLGQYVGWIPKIYSRFTMTGPFNNPAGISSSLALLYPFSLYFCYRSKEIIGRLSILASLLMAVTVILCGARAAILAVAISTFIFIIHFLKRKTGISFTALHYGAMSVTCILLFTVLYFMKKDSADGRLLIWHCSGQLVKQAPLFGHGVNGFAAHYMTEQANYFSKNPDSKYAMLADNIEHPFNEFIKEMVEYGVIGFLLTLLLLFYPFYYSRKDKSMELFVARISILSLGICALFSYPLDYPFVLLMVVLLVAFVSASMKKTDIAVSDAAFTKRLLVIFSVILFTVTGYEVYYEYKWKFIAYSSLAGQTEIMLPEYDNLYKNTYLGNKGLFVYNYGAELNYIGKYKDSNHILLLT